jgi:hypothetical protein
MCVTDESEPSRQVADPETFAGHQLRRLRQARGWSMREATEYLNQRYGYHWHQSVLAKVETAQRPLRLNEMFDLASLFGVPLRELVPFTGWPPPTDVEKKMCAIVNNLAGIEDKITAVRQAAALTQAEMQRLTAAAERLSAQLELEDSPYRVRRQG